ncbi:hypothetical protein [Vibrio sp. WXL210]|uniref:hypothetical protein n=1 Tax=Vibrio sp. WXL210 TaxID=3450709 RepID=UPI003EC5DF46
MKYTFRLLFSAAALSLSLNPVAHASNQQCSAEQLEWVKTDKRSLTPRWEGAEFGENIAHSACRTLPHDEGALFVSYLTEILTEETYEEFRNYMWRVALFDKSTGKVRAGYQGIIAEDAGTRVNPHQGAFVLDTAPYRLNESTRAIGVRQFTSYSPPYADGSTSDEITLFIERDGELKPVLRQLPLYWGRSAWDSDNPRYYRANLQIQLGQKQQQGMVDLILTGRSTWSAGYGDDEQNGSGPRIRFPMVFDGEQYEREAYWQASSDWSEAISAQLAELGE